MTEAEWLAATRPYDLTHYKACRSERKRRLLSCAFARRVLFLIPDERYRLAIELAECYADGMATAEQLQVTKRVIIKAWNERFFTEAGNHAATAALATLKKKAVEAIHGLESAAAARAALAHSRRRAGRRRLRQRRHPPSLPQARRTRARLLGRRSAARERMMVAG
jgi:hypothetical protein